VAGRFRRLFEQDRKPLSFTIDGKPAIALSGDTLLTALLTSVDHLRWSEFGDGMQILTKAPESVWPTSN